MRQKRSHTRSASPYISGVINRTRRFLQEKAPSDGIRLLCEQRLDLFQGRVKNQGFAPSIDIPYLVSYGLTGDSNRSESISVLCTLLYLGSDLLDDLHDREPSLLHDHHSTGQITLVASLLLSALPTMAVARFFGPSDPRSVHACQRIAESLRVMAGGQSEDIRFQFNPDVSVDDVKASVLAKSGEEMALFCRLAIIFSGKGSLEIAARFGSRLGVALQTASDLSDLLEASLGEDLKVGNLTLPLILHYSSLPKKERPLFLRFCKDNAGNSEGRCRLCQTLKRSGALARAALEVEADCKESKISLQKLLLNRSSEEKLELLIDKILNYGVSHFQSRSRPAAESLWDGCRLMGM